MCADLYAVFIFELIAIAESSGSKIEIFIQVGLLAPLPGARDTGPSPGPRTANGGLPLLRDAR